MKSVSADFKKILTICKSIPIMSKRYTIMKSIRKKNEEKVFESTETLMLRHGIKGWNMNDLAEASGITKRTLYKIIVSKEQLIRDVAFKNLRSIEEKVFEIIKSDSGFMERLERLIITIPEIFKNNYINNYSDILNEFPELEADIVRESEKITSDLRLFFQDGIDNGCLRKDVNPALVQQMIQAFIIYFAKYVASEAELADKIRISLQCLIHGISSQSHSDK